MSEVLTNIVSIFLVILVGVYGYKKGIITEKVERGLVELLLNITLPLLIISSFCFTFDSNILPNIIRAFIYSFLCFLISIPLSFVLLKWVKSEGKRKVLQFSNVFSNCGFIGFPVVGSVYGVEGVIYASIFNLFFTLFLWTYGVMLYSEKGLKIDIKKILLSPGMVAVYIGLPILIFRIAVPKALLSSIDLVGNMTIPISMIILGAILSKVNLEVLMKDWTIYYGTFLKLLIIPFSVFIMGKILRDESIVVKVLILVQGMPAATTTAIFSGKFNREKEYSAIIVFVTTLFSVFTLPILINLITKV